MKRDLPKMIAGVLWFGGIAWAVFIGIVSLLPWTWLLWWYWLLGFAVWFGWLWRSHRLRAQVPSMLLWFLSILVNAGWLVAGDPPDSIRWFNIYSAWWSFATLASVVALIGEIWVARDDHAV
jgi:hypothetical protein